MVLRQARERSNATRMSRCECRQCKGVFTQVLDKVGSFRIIYTMKTTIGVQSDVGAEVRQLSWARSFFAKVAKFFDGLILKYYYKGERLRPEVRAEMEKEMDDALQGKNVSPVFTDVDEAFDWLDSQKQ